MTPAEELQAAAERLKGLVVAVPHEGPWRTDRYFWKVGSTRGLPDGYWCEVADDTGTVVLASEQDGAEEASAIVHYVAAMGPSVGKALAELLNEGAAHLDSGGNGVAPELLTVARAINGGAS